MKAPVIIGIDTSNYTTSLALMDIDGNLICNLRRLLPVGKGSLGLRQSDAVFAHIKNIPYLTAELRGYLSGRNIAAVGVSTAPRKQVGSYMPCFLSGVSLAEGISASVGSPIYKFSHQCGHIMAALYSCGSGDIINGEFGAFHISGGTTEMLKVKLSADGLGFDAVLLGGTADLNAGQVIDRIGVMLGLDFPCGGALDKLAVTYKGRLPKKKPAVRDFKISLSGLENMAKRLYGDTQDSSITAAFVFEYIGNSVIELTDAFIDKHGNMPMVYAGGVMRNSIIRKKLSLKYDAYFAEPDMSSDNAVGIAALALRAYRTEKNK